MIQVLEELGDFEIHPDVSFLDRLFESNSLQARTSAEGNVDLSMRECSPTYVDDDVFECFALAFVDCNCPGESDRKLVE